MLPKPVRLWLAEMSDDSYIQLRKMYQRIGYNDIWENFLTEIYEADQVGYPSTQPQP